jgi:hypothetical protein
MWGRPGSSAFFRFLALGLLAFAGAISARAELIVFSDGRVVKAASHKPARNNEIEISLPGGGSYTVDAALVDQVVADEVAASAAPPPAAAPAPAPPQVKRAPAPAVIVPRNDFPAPLPVDNSAQAKQRGQGQTQGQGRRGKRSN